MYLFAPDYIHMYNRILVALNPAAFLPRRKHASTFMYSMCARETLWVIPNGRICEAIVRFGIRQVPTIEQAPNWALLKATRVHFADMCSLYIDSTFRICPSAFSQVDVGDRQREFLS